MAEQRARLQLQVVLLTEQCSAKIVALLEELRRELPDVRDRVDPQAQAMQRSSDPEVILDTLHTREQDAARPE